MPSGLGKWAGWFSGLLVKRIRMHIPCKQGLQHSTAGYCPLLASSEPESPCSTHGTGEAQLKQGLLPSPAQHPVAKQGHQS